MKIFLIPFYIILIYSFSIDKTNKYILDSNGRATIFHGVNIVYKLPPYIPKTDKFDPYFSLSKEDISIMKKLGFNLVRLGIIWESVEKKEGIYDMEYLNQMEEIINELGKEGIFTMIDAHQDVFSRTFCGEGVPYFYTKKLNYDKTCNGNFLSKIFGYLKLCIPMKNFNFKYDKNNLPLIDDCKKNGFEKYHYTPEFTTAYKKFYENENNIQDKFIEFWKIIAKKFKSNKYIIGFDLWNEPFPGGMFQDLTKIIPSNPDKTQVIPFYKKVDKSIREIFPDYILFFENTFFPDTLPIFNGLHLGSINEIPSEKKDKVVYNVHTYCCLSNLNMCSEGEPNLYSSQNICPKFHKKKIKKNIKDSKKLKVPLIISEFGACSDSESCYNEIISVVKKCGNNLISWAYWNYKPFGDHTTSAIQIVEKEGIFNKDGSIQFNKEKSLSLSYVQFYQGIPIMFKYSSLDFRDFETSFVYNKYVLGETRIYFNKNLFYESGYEIYIIDNKGNNVMFSKKEVDENYIDIEILNISNMEILLLYFKGL